MSRSQNIIETNSHSGGFLVDSGTNQIVGTTARGIDKYFAVADTEAEADSFVTAQTNPLTGVVSLNGFKQCTAQTAYIMGDSHAAQHTVNTASTKSHTAEGAVHWANWLLGSPISVLRNLGTGGVTAAYVATSQLPTVLSAKPDFCFVFAGTNDIYASAATAAETLASVILLVTSLHAAGIVPVYTTIPARDYSTANALRDHLYVNDGLRLFARTSGIGILWDSFRVMCDPASTQCVGRAGFYRDSGPAAHANNVGAQWQGKALAAALTAWGLKKQFPLVVGAETYTNTQSAWSNLLDNSAMTGTSGTASTGITGTVPTGYTVARGTGTPTATASIVDVTDTDTELVVGKGLQLAITAGAANDEIIITNTDAPSRYVNGGSYEAEALLTLASPVNVLTLRGRVQTDSGAGESSWFGTQTYTASAIPEGFTNAVFRSLPNKPTGTVSTGQFSVRIKFSAAGSATLTVALPRVRRVS